MPKVNPSLVVDVDSPVTSVLLKKTPQFLKHRFMFRISESWRIRRRQQTTLEACVVEILAHSEGTLLVRKRIEELIYRLRGSFVPDIRIIGSVGQQQMFVVAKKRS